tara:strand:- start:175 stop:408 length:234 start_codon:yes stop_codon:yes gene_type:complete
MEYTLKVTVTHKESQDIVNMGERAYPSSKPFHQAAGDLIHLMSGYTFTDVNGGVTRSYSPDDHMFTVCEVDGDRNLR